MTNSNMEIATFGDDGSVTVPVKPNQTAAHTLQVIGKALGLKESSMQHFSLYRGPLGTPHCQLQDESLVPSGATLSFQKRLAHGKEIKLLKTDDKAVHLLFKEALFHYKQTPSKLVPTPEQREKMEEFLDPSFPTERQFLEIAMEVEGYDTVQSNHCILKSTVVHDGKIIEPNKTISCTFSLKHLEIKTAEITAQWPWQHVKRWSLESPTLAKFNVSCRQGNTGILEWIHIETIQAPLLVQAALALCELILKTIHPERVKTHQATGGIPAGKVVDPLYEHLNNLLFGSGPKFTSLS